MERQTAKGKGWIKATIFLIVLLIPGAWYFNEGHKQFAEGLSAYEALNCPTADLYFDAVSSTYWLAFSSATVSEARALKKECSLLIEAEEKLAQGDYAVAIEKYHAFVAEYKNKPSSYYESLGQKLLDKKHYLAAMAVYGDAKALTGDSAARARLESGYQGALTKLAADTDVEGPYVLAEAIDALCLSKPRSVSSPAVGASQEAAALVCSPGDEAGTAYLGDWTALEAENFSTLLPESWMATAPGNLRYVVNVRNITDESADEASECGPYAQYGLIGRKFVKRIAYRGEIDLIDVRTGEVIGQQELRGTEPVCPGKILSTDSAVYGELVPASVVQYAAMDLLAPWLHRSASRTLADHTESITSLAFSPDGKWLAAGSADKTVTLWDARSGLKMYTLEAHKDAVTSIAFSLDGKWLASGSADKTMTLWDMSSGKIVRTLRGYTGSITSLAFSPDGKWLAAGSVDKRVRLWDVTNGQIVRTLKDHAKPVTSVAFSPDGKWLASGAADAMLRLWDVSGGFKVRNIGDPSEELAVDADALGWLERGAINSIAFSPDGKWLVSGSADKMIVLWDMTSGLGMRILKGHTDTVSSIAFSPDGEWLVSGSADKKVKLWDAASGIEIRTLASSANGVTAVAFSPDGNWLAIGSTDGTVLLRQLVARE